MDKQLIFFLMLAFLFLFRGIATLNIAILFAGVALLIFLIYDNLINHGMNRRYRNNSGVKSINFIGFLGNFDLAVGILLLIRVFYGIIPLGLISFLTIIVLLKAATFIWGGDIASILDVISSIIIFSSGTIEIPGLALIIISIYFIQKGILSFFSG